MVLKRRIRESARVGLGLAVPAVLVAGVVSMGGALPASAATSVDFSYTASGWTASHFPYCPDYTPLDVVAVGLGERVTHLAQLARADAAEGERVEHEHHVLLAAQLRELHGGAVLVLELEIRGLVADFNRHSSDPFSGSRAATTSSCRWGRSRL